MGASPRTGQRQGVERARRIVAGDTTCGAFTLTIPGPPVGFARMRTGHGRTFIPDKQRAHMDAIRAEWAAQGRPVLPADAYYKVAVTALHDRPAGHLLRDGSLSAEGRRRPYPGAPDVDNVGKLLLDALVAAGAVPDDRRMVGLHVWKRWTGDGERALVRCVVRQAQP
jgi:Holliday junction resolvase RusA-like endonuclease